MHSKSIREDKRSSSRSKATAVDSCTNRNDVSGKHDEYLLYLQQKNRALNNFKIKDPLQAKLEHLEQGFSVYLNGANAELKKQHSAHDLTRGCLKTATAKDYGVSFLPGRNNYTAPGKIQRKVWIQNSINIKSESGSPVRIGPTLKYSEDFESDSDVPSDQSDQSDENEQVVRESLEQSLSLQHSSENCFADEYDSVEEEMENEMQEEPESVTDFVAKSSNAIQRRLLPGDLVVLEFKGTECQQSRPLSAVRKTITDVQDPVHSASQVMNAFQQENKAVEMETSRQMVVLTTDVQVKYSLLAGIRKIDLPEVIAPSPGV